MGDEFDADGPVKLKVLVHGTRPIARVDIIKDFVYVYLDRAEGPAGRVPVDRRRDGRPAGLSWYYVRAIQDDGQLAWASPIWGGRPAGRTRVRESGRPFSPGPPRSQRTVRSRGVPPGGADPDVGLRNRDTASPLC